MLFLPLNTLYLIALNVASSLEPHLFLVSVLVSSLILTSVSRKNGPVDSVFLSLMLFVFSLVSSSVHSHVCLRSALFSILMWGVIEAFLRLRFPAEWLFWSMYALSVAFFISVCQLDFLFNPFIETSYGYYRLPVIVFFPFLVVFLVYFYASRRLILPYAKPLYEYRFTPASFSLFLVFSLIVLRYAFLHDVFYQGLAVVIAVPFLVGMGYIYSRLAERDISPAGKYAVLLLAVVLFPLTALLGLATIFFNRAV